MPGEFSFSLKITDFFPFTPFTSSLTWSLNHFMVCLPDFSQDKKEPEFDSDQKDTNTVCFAHFLWNLRIKVVHTSSVVLGWIKGNKICFQSVYVCAWLCACVDKFCACVWIRIKFELTWHECSHSSQVHFHIWTRVVNLNLPGTSDYFNFFG